MRCRTLLGALCSAFVAALPASASAADTVAITPPAAPPPQDAAFALTLSGTTDIHPGDNDPYLRVRVRPAGGVPCSVNAAVDAGTDLLSSTLSAQGGSFQKSTTYTPETPGDYLVCAWITELGDSDHVYAGPVSTTISVRAPNLGITMNAPATIRPGGTLPVGIDYSAEVSRYLSVVFAQAPNCNVSASALRSASAQYADVWSDTVSGVGHADKAASVPTATGQYRLCGYYTRRVGTSDPAQLVVAGPVVNVAIPTLKCAKVNTRRRTLSDVKAIGISCGSARSVARRWGTPRRTPRLVGSYTCRAYSGKRVTCTSSAGKVTFRYRR